MALRTVPGPYGPPHFCLQRDLQFARLSTEITGAGRSMEERCNVQQISESRTVTHVVAVERPRARRRCQIILQRKRPFASALAQLKASALEEQAPKS